MELDGLVLTNRDFGYCKITAHTGNQVRMRFIGTNRDAWYGVGVVAAQRDFKWQPLPVGLRCRVDDRGTCTVIEAPFEPSQAQGVHEYLVRFDDAAGETAHLSERELWPIPGSLIETPTTKLASLQVDSLSSFRARDRLQGALEQLDRESANIRALAASRIALLPHQAYVIGTVIDDPVWRYILADEVGLGKTIEAGAIAHQLLSQKPDARILVLCPGPLARQWLCEMHLSFGGRDFRLVDLHPAEMVSFKKWPLVICSLKMAVREHHQQILATAWDLVIIDEAHQLLWNLATYALAEQLAAKVSRLLLLSAIPARERDRELMQLLRLIDPERYREGTAVAQKFSALYANQSIIGRRLRLVTRQLDRPDDIDLEQLEQDAQRLITLAVLQGDEELQRLEDLARQQIDQAQKVNAYRQLTDAVVSRYRISRRILKNRRARLVDAELLAAVPRTLEVLMYEASALEQRIESNLVDLLQGCGAQEDASRGDASEKDGLQEGANESGKLHADALQVLFRKTAQSLCDPVALYDIANALNTADVLEANDATLLDANAALDYDEHEGVLEACAAALSAGLDATRVSDGLGLLRAAIEVPEHPRMKRLKACVGELMDGDLHKLLVFAGTYGAAEYVAVALRGEFGDKSVASFRHDQDDSEKESEVARFARDAACTILVSDESGGEGRNFQFADALIHFDLPWSVSAIEQRIGRLDRIGRDRPVRSYVICATGGVEEAWLRCLDQGFGVFTRSISGLEFMLHETEREVLDAAITGGSPEVMDKIEAIAEASERERASDDAEALTDAASFRSSRRYLRTAESVADKKLEESLPYYLRAIGRSEAARHITDRKDANLKIWRLVPEEVTDYRLVGLERQGNNPLQDYFGTFSRSVAHERPDLEFFSTGHTLVDALSIALREHIRGRSLIAKLPAGDLSPGLVLLSGWRVSLRPKEGANAWPEPATRLLATRMVWIGLDLQTGQTLGASILGSLTAQLRDKESDARDLAREQAVQAFGTALGAWSDSLDQLLKRAQEQADAHYRTKYQAVDSAFCDQLLLEARAVARTRADEGDEYAQVMAATIGAIQRVELELDVVGLIKLEAAPSP